ncbi:MAG: hypothetical protein ACJAXJ_000433 [Colwellia sp.]|jgi:hypothetical protein
MIENLFLSVGAMKAGTTWVYDKLQHNPNIIFSKEKEIYYFSHIDGVANSLDSTKRVRRAKQATQQSARLLNKNEITLKEHNEALNWYFDYAGNEVNDDWYEQLFGFDNCSSNSNFCADFSNLTCFLSEDGWEHVKNIAKNVKVIYILRNPVDRFWSHYKFHLQFIKHAEMNTPEQNIKLFERVTSKKWFIRNSMYSENITNMRKYLAEHEFKIYFLDDISTEPEKYLEDIENFIGVDNFDYSSMKLQARKNSSIVKNIPDLWLKKIEAVLSEEVERLKELGLWHKAWTANNTK